MCMLSLLVFVFLDLWSSIVPLWTAAPASDSGSADSVSASPAHLHLGDPVQLLYCLLLLWLLLWLLLSPLLLPLPLLTRPL